MARFWESVPQVSWTGTRVDAPIESTNKEPSVVANVAVAVESDAKLETTAVATTMVPVDPLGSEPDNGTATSELPTTSSGSSTSDATLIEQSAGGEPAKFPPPPTAFSNHGEQSGGRTDQEDNIERLRAALNEDAARGREDSEPAGGAHDVRVRVESLLERSRRLFDLGRLTDARHTAQVARDLGDTARIDYSPDEERPVDLMNRIDDQLQASAIEAKPDANQNQSANTTNTPKSLVAISEKTTDTAGPTDTPNEMGSAAETMDEEPSGRFHLRRDWSYGMGVFRRDRKSPLPPERHQESLPESSNTIRVQIGFEPAVDGNEDVPRAVVQANRGVTPASHETSTTGYAANDPALATAGTVHRTTESYGDSTVARRPPVKSISESDEWPARDRPNRSGNFPIPEETVQRDESRRLEIENLPPVPPEFEDVRPLSAFHEVKPGAISERTVSDRDESAVYSIWGWCAGVVGFLICGLLALTCYRRGAV